MSEKKRLEWSRRAEHDLGAIHDYIAADNPKAAGSVVRFLLASVERLIEFPVLGHGGLEAGTREMVVTRYPYTIVYRLTSTKIRILTVLHQSRQYP